MGWPQIIFGWPAILLTLVLFGVAFTRERTSLGFVGLVVSCSRAGPRCVPKA
jgi:hypothetical protein